MSTPIPSAAATAPIAFGSFGARLRAMVIDIAVVLGAMLGTLLVVEIAGSIPGVGRIGVLTIVGLVVLYEPLMVWRVGGTVGHRSSNLLIVDDATGAHPSFWRSFLRYVLKGVLGWLSFVTMAVSRRHQAMHDGLTRTTVRIRDLDRARPTDIRWEREPEEHGGMPSGGRRTLVIVSYSVLSFVFIMFAAATQLSDACALEDRCSRAEDTIATAAGFAWMGATAIFIIAGWRGKLWGARRQPFIAADIGPILPES